MKQHHKAVSHHMAKAAHHHAKAAEAMAKIHEVKEMKKGAKMAEMKKHRGRPAKK